MHAVEVLNVYKRLRKETRKLTKTIEYTFRPEYKQVLNNVSFNIKKGEIFGLLGPNGAGKTTLLKIITGLMEADYGKIQVLNHKIPNEVKNIKDRINAVFARAGIYWGMTIRENIEWYGQVYRIKDLQHKVDGMIELFDLGNKSDRYADRCSTGELMRAKLAISLLNDPELIFLDEPTIGLDPVISLKVREFFARFNKEKKTTIMLTTHFMDEADNLCDRVAIIDKGEILDIDTPKNLKKRVKKENVVEMDVDKMSHKALAEIKALKKVRGIDYTPETEEIRIVFNDINGLNKVMKTLEKNKIKFHSVHTEKASLEDVFIYYTGRGLE